MFLATCNLFSFARKPVAKTLLGDLKTKQLAQIIIFCYLQATLQRVFIDYLLKKTKKNINIGLICLLANQPPCKKFFSGLLAKTHIQKKQFYFICLITNKLAREQMLGLPAEKPNCKVFRFLYLLLTIQFVKGLIFFTFLQTGSKST